MAGEAAILNLPVRHLRPRTRTSQQEREETQEAPLGPTAPPLPLHPQTTKTPQRTEPSAAAEEVDRWGYHPVEVVVTQQAEVVVAEVEAPQVAHQTVAETRPSHRVRTDRTQTPERMRSRGYADCLQKRTKSERANANAGNCRSSCQSKSSRLLNYRVYSRSSRRISRR
jgi:hypothetical protein